MNMQCGNEPYNKDAYAPGLAPKCILQLKHKGPHTDGEKQWYDAEVASLDSNYDLEQRESAIPKITIDIPMPKEVRMPSPNVVQIAANNSALFALDSNGQIWSISIPGQWIKVSMPVLE